MNSKYDILENIDIFRGGPGLSSFTTMMIPMIREGVGKNDDRYLYIFPTNPLVC